MKKRMVELVVLLSFTTLLQAQISFDSTVAIGFTHHSTQRGNNRKDVFFVDDDRGVYLELLKEQADKYSLDLVGYCLMSNHIHIVAIPHE